MLRAFQREYHLPGVRDLIREYTKTCEGCQHFGHIAGRSRVVSQPIKTTRALQHLQMDLAKHPRDAACGAEYTCALKDLFTGYIWATELYSKDAEVVAAWVLDIFTQEHIVPDGFYSTGRITLNKPLQKHILDVVIHDGYVNVVIDE